MNKIIGAVSVLFMAIALIFAQSTPTFADVIVNNVLSPFTTIYVEPGYRVARPPTWWLHDPNYNARCYNRWDSYYGEWRNFCVRMNYGRGGHYDDRHGGHYGDRYGDRYDDRYGGHYRDRHGGPY